MFVDFTDDWQGRPEPVKAKTVAIVMATIPHRALPAQRVLTRMLPQCDRMYVHLDGYAEAPAWILGKGVPHFVHPIKKGSTNRFSVIPEEDVTFVVDDDIEYPEDYVIHTVNTLARLGPGHAVVHHGAWWPVGKPAVYKHRQLSCYWKACAEDEVIPYVGAGTLALLTADLRRLEVNAPTQFAFQCDVWISAALARAGIRCVRPPCKDQWIKRTPAGKKGLYTMAGKDGHKQRDARIAEALALGKWKLTR